MRVLLVRPICPNERFGLGPFFRVEPLGMEYVAAALLRNGHEVKLADLRFSESLPRLLQRFRPRLVGIASQHTVDTRAAAETARAVKQYDSGIFTLLGGHAAAAYPGPVQTESVDAISLEDGEATVPAVVDALERGGDLASVPGLRVRNGPGCDDFVQTPGSDALIGLDDVPLPARQLVAPIQKHYMVLQKTPLYAVETARGCPFRCTFCSIWRLMKRTYRVRGIDAVCRDFAATGDNIFVVDDLFWHPRKRSVELGREIVRRGLRKDWILVQSRLDTVAKGGELLEAWRPFSREIDIFFGFEAPTDQQLKRLDKNFDVSLAEQGVKVAREQGYGVTGNFVVDPDWTEQDFRAMWDMVDQLGLHRVGYTIMTPLPGTPLFDEMKNQIVEKDWSKYDMHHILYEPRLGRRRFFELFAESWKRNVLGPKFSVRSWLGWLRDVRFTQMALLVRTIYRSQRLLSVNAYLNEAFPLQIPAKFGGQDSAGEARSEM